MDFDAVLDYFDFGQNDHGDELIIDLTQSQSANFQALVLLVQYAWFKTSQGCSVLFKFGSAQVGATRMLTQMNALSWLPVLMHDGRDFGSGPGRRTYALRRRADVQNVLNQARASINKFEVGFPDYLSYIISEMLFNSTEHGKRSETIDGSLITIPSIFQFGYYPQFKRLSFFFSDLGIGIKRHLEQSYAPLRNHEAAILYALEPEVTGTSRAQHQPYASVNNAGMGLTISSLMMKRLKGDMYIGSGEGLVHVSPEDVTSRALRSTWPGTFVLVNLDLNAAEGITLDQLMAEVEAKASAEVQSFEKKEQEATFTVGIFIVFGQYAEDKEFAIRYRDAYLMPAVLSKKKIILDFAEVKTAPHSFLNALIATPAKTLGIAAYQRIKIINAASHIRQIIDTVLEQNLPTIE